jgi:hypothetical protein
MSVVSMMSFLSRYEVVTWWKSPVPPCMSRAALSVTPDPATNSDLSQSSPTKLYANVYLPHYVTAHTDHITVHHCDFENASNVN